MANEHADGSEGSRPLSVGERAWISRCITFVAIGLIVLLCVYVIYPAVINSRARRLFRIATLIHEKGDAERALEIYERIPAEYPKAAIVKRAEEQAAELAKYIKMAYEKKLGADAALKSQQYVKAWELYSVLLKDFPHSRYGQAALENLPNAAAFACRDLAVKAQKVERSEEWDLAEMLYRRIIGIDPDSEGAAEGLQRAVVKMEEYHKLLKQGEAYAGKKNWRLCRAYYEKALQVLPKDREAYEGRSRALQQLPTPKDMVLIVPGFFMTGGGGVRPSRRARLDGFYMDVTEVTNGEYARFVAATGHQWPSHWGGEKPDPSIANLPVVCVSQLDVGAYAKWAGKRLPTALEWERAARGLNAAVFPWGNEFSLDKAVYGNGHTPAGFTTSDKSVEGCMDLAGSVSEWTSSAEERGVVVCGNSWAGFEEDRAERIVPDDIAETDSDPTRTVLVGHADAWGLTVRGLSEITFFLWGSINCAPVFAVRRYLPEFDQFVGVTFVIKKGMRIVEGKNIRIKYMKEKKREDGMGQLPNLPSNEEGRWEEVVVSRRIEFDTGHTLEEVKILDGEQIEAVVEDSRGIRRTLRRVKRERKRPARAHADPERARFFAAILKDLQNRQLRHVARASRRMWAPPLARFMNCGFRCARDLEPAEAAPHE